MNLANARRFTGAMALLMACSSLLISPFYETLIVAHAAMIAVVLFWFLFELPKSLLISIITFVIFSIYLIAVNLTVPLGNRVFPESIKYTILIFFIIAILNSPQFLRKTLLLLSILIPTILLFYVVFSDDPYVYGGRLGILIDSYDGDAMISANTLGFFINICFVTILARKPNLLVYYLPISLFLLYLTLSRGAFLSLGIVGIAYFLRRGHVFFVAILIFISAGLFVDLNFSLISNTLRLDDATGSGRTLLYAMMFENIWSNPITLFLGHGPGSIDFEIYSGKVLISAHNGYLEMIYTFGALGFFAIAYFISRLFRNFWTIPLDSLLYAVTIAGYAISEDLLGAHNLLPLGIMIALILHEFGNCALNRRAAYLDGSGLVLSKPSR